jgi:hypothetical protein
MDDVGVAANASIHSIKCDAFLAQNFVEFHHHGIVNRRIIHGYVTDL